MAKLFHILKHETVIYKGGGRREGEVGRGGERGEVDKQSTQCQATGAVGIMARQIEPYFSPRLEKVTHLMHTRASW